MKRICSKTLMTCLSVAALATAGQTLTGGAAVAQDVEQITVVPAHSGYHHERRTRHHVTLSQRVGFSDLDLRTDGGARTLGIRIGYAAVENCKLLDRYELDSMTPAAKSARRQSCITDAVYGTQPQVDAVMFAARQ